MSDGRKRRPRPPGGELPRETMPARGSEMFTGKAGMMRLPVHVPSDRRSGGGRSKGPKPSRSAPAPSQLISLSDTGIQALPSESKDLVVVHDRDGAFASELRILATRLDDLRGRLGYRSFLVTSVSNGDGKTVAATNLALALSEDSDRRVALVDANFRAPRVGELFNLDPERGLRGVLENRYPLAQCVARVVGRNLIVLQAAGQHANPSALLSSPHLKSLLAELYQAVDFLIVDAPSALPHADVPLLTRHVDAVLLVGAAHRTRRAALDRAVETIGRDRVAGSVFMQRRPARRAMFGRA